MKRLIISLIATVSATTAFGQADFPNPNYGFYVAETPVDVENFVNHGIFVGPGLPYTTFNTVNYTNTGAIYGAGLLFETSPSGTGLSRPAANFINEVPGALVSGSIVEVRATNIYSRGAFSSDPKGRITLKGETVDLFASRLTNSTPAGVFDNFWGTGKTDFLGGYGDSSASSPSVGATFLSFGNGYFNGFTSVSVQSDEVPDVYTNNVQVFVNSVGADGPTPFHQIVFLKAPFDTNILAELKFNSGRVVVRWSGAIQHPESTIYNTNYLYFEDRLATMDLEEEALISMPRIIPGSPNPYPGFMPTNYLITTEYNNWGFGPAATPSEEDPLFPAPVREDNMDYSIWGATLRANTALANPTSSPGASITNAPGRIEIIADKSLNLNRTRINAENYLLVRATNHFEGNFRSYLDSPYYDLDLASTNGVLNLDGLIPDNIMRFVGGIRAYSMIWTHQETVDDVETETTFHVVIIDSANLRISEPPRLHAFKGRASEIVLGDIFNVDQNLRLDCVSLTLTTNGQLNLGQDIVWRESLPNVRNLTNSGIITANALLLSEHVLPSAPFGSPYDSIVNHGSIFANGINANAQTLINSGSIQTGGGDLNLQFGNAFITNDSLTSVQSGGGVLFSGQSLELNNAIISANNRIVLDVSNVLDDGGPTGNVTWMSGAGFDLVRKPGSGDLLGSWIIASAEPFSEFKFVWAAEDRGLSSSGYANNAAVGELWLDGGFASIFKFVPATGLNAIYIENLVLSEAIELDYEYSFLVDPNFTVYFQNLLTFIEDDEGAIDIQPSAVDPSEFASKVGGMRWMGNARAAVNLRDAQGNIIGTIEVDSALRNSGSVDSDGDGVVNQADEFPFDGPVLQTQLTEAGAVQLNWNAAANTTYTLWCTHDLTTWQQVTQVVSGSSAGPLGVQIPALTNACTFKLSYSP